MRVLPAAIPAKFRHESEPVQLRLQCFLLLRDEQRKVACLRLENAPDLWNLPGETLRLNEDPHDAARRVAKTWFESAIPDPRLVDVFSYPPTGGDDDRWYLLFVYEAPAPKGLKGTPDTVALSFAAPGSPPGPFAMSHSEVFERVR